MKHEKEHHAQSSLCHRILFSIVAATKQSVERTTTNRNKHSGISGYSATAAIYSCGLLRKLAGNNNAETIVIHQHTRRIHSVYMDNFQNHKPLDTRQYIWCGIVVVSTSNRHWVHLCSGFDPRSRNVILGMQTWLSTLETVHALVGRGSSMVGGTPFRNLGKFVYPRMCNLLWTPYSREG